MNKDYSRAIPDTWRDISTVFAALGDEHRQRILLTFEPGERLNVGQIAEIIHKVNAEGIAVIFNEQNVKLSFGISNHGYLLESGRVMLSGTGDEMMNSDVIRRVYLGE